MSCVATLTNNNQITIPKNVREFLGVKAGERVVFDFNKKTVTLQREKTLKETLAEMRALVPEDVRRKWMENNAGKTAGQIREEWLESDAAKEYYTKRLEETL